MADKKLSSPLVGGLSDQGEASSGIHYNTITDHRTPTKELKTLTQKVTVFNEMKTNSTISGILLAFMSICQTAKTLVNENKDDPDRERAKERAKFLQECLDDMQTPFTDVRGEILDMIPMGFRVIIPQFKLRSGYDNNSNFNSKHNDGKIGWKNFTPIDPSTISGWLTKDGQGYYGLTGVKQQTSLYGTEVIIPRHRLLLFRTISQDGNILGKSILEGAYKDYVDLMDANGIQMVGLRRSLVGIPYARIHSSIAAKADNGNIYDQASIQAAISAVQDLDSRVDNAFTLPSDRDERGNLLIEVGMIGAGEGGGNTHTQDAKVIIDAKEQNIARSMLAQFMTIQGKGGSYALSKTQSEVFINSLKMYMEQVAGVLNNEAVPRLFAINGEGVGTDDNYLPTIQFSDFIKDDVTEFFGALQKSIDSGIFEVTPQIQKKAGQVMNIDISGQEEALEARKAKAEELEEREAEMFSQAQEADDNEDAHEKGGDDDSDDGEATPETKSSDITDSGLKDILKV